MKNSMQLEELGFSWSRPELKIGFDAASFQPCPAFNHTE